MDCLNEDVLSSYLDEAISKEEHDRIEHHISNCNRCLDMLLVAYESQGRLRRCRYAAGLEKKVRDRLGFREKRKKTELKWLFSALSLFMLSFVFKRFFLQFLVAAGILGFKWVMEGEGARRVVMIFRGIEKEKRDRDTSNQLL